MNNEPKTVERREPGRRVMEFGGYTFDLDEPRLACELVLAREYQHEKPKNEPTQWYICDEGKLRDDCDGAPFFDSRPFVPEGGLPNEVVGDFWRIDLPDLLMTAAEYDRAKQSFTAMADLPRGRFK